MLHLYNRFGADHAHVDLINYIRHGRVEHQGARNARRSQGVVRLLAT